ncbi:hypothetical protein IV203_014017 [Nitzschia inconspicua]|uniref:Uncharacterized protein n=1 Tax=Nitzschia inconspicua TaxID=303405 RepID=A0A9K3Q7W1_9STRA|nr:hypothetical protein IV203_014017 [Nitzschia inconspicua]
MARSKNSTKKTSDGNRRKETKEERKERLRLQKEAREQCFKTLPYAGGVVVVLMLIFALWVRSVPPKAPAVKMTVTETDLGQSRPEDDPALQEAFKLAQEQETLNQQQQQEEANAEIPSDNGDAAAAVSETIEL